MSGGCLYRRQRRPGRQRLGDERPPQVVRLEVNAAFFFCRLDDPVDVRAGDRLVRAEIATLVDRAEDELASHLLTHLPRSQRFLRELASERHFTMLVAFAVPDGDHAVVEVDVLPAQRGCFRPSQRAQRHDRDQRVVAPVDVGRLVPDPQHLVGF